MTPSLTVYKASAGSGKTFTLATEYIKILAADPTAYKNILAVTFTNKATEEMKQRILSQLYGIAHGLSDSEKYRDAVLKTATMDEDSLRAAAARALTLLLHNYDFFHIETIDSFFQSILRNLARELDLSANLRIELQDKRVEDIAVDKLIEDLNRKSPLFTWLLRYIMNTIGENKSWNIIRSVKAFGKKIFDDEYKKQSKLLTATLAQDDFIDNFSSQLKGESQKALESLTALQGKFADTLQQAGIDATDFAGGSRGIGAYYENLTTTGLAKKEFMPSVVKKSLDSAEAWAKTKDKRREYIIGVARDVLMPLLSKTEEQRLKSMRTIASVDATLKNINNLRLLSDIEKKVREVNQDTNSFLLSDTQQLLHQMTDGSDTPFIFEKIGPRLNHIMIDEFQDTSTVQWNNFKVLIDECMSRAQSTDAHIQNLIVGDVKQSIYRWRAGDWQLLGGIENLFPTGSVDIQRLSTNYRSCRNIISFNNTFFTTAVSVEAGKEADKSKPGAAMIASAYMGKEPTEEDNDLTQKANKTEDEGLVEIRLLPKEDYTERMLQQVEEIIDSILQNGEPQKKIAILLRSNRNITLLADYFSQKRPELSLVSDEAFLLSKSVAVSILVTAIRVLTNPEDGLSWASLAKLYQQAVIKSDLSDDELFNNNCLPTHLLPDSFTQQLDTLLAMPLHDLTEHLYDIFSLASLKDESAYVCAFFDTLSSYTRDMSADMKNFLREWDSTLSQGKVQTDDVDGIRLLSIHKSKGLEFDNVIIPFADWRLELYQDNYIWCRPKEAPFNQLPLLPVDYSPKLANTIYADDYLAEHTQNVIDNLNMLYVAFTRAGNNLYVLGARNSSLTRSQLIEDCLPAVSQALEGATLTGDDDEQKDIVFSYGTFKEGEDNKKNKKTKDKDKKKKKEPTRNVFLKPRQTTEIDIRTHDIPLGFRQSNKSKDFVNSDNEEYAQRSAYINRGNLLHSVFSHIYTTDDIHTAVAQLERDGLLDNHQEAQKLEADILACINTNDTTRSWFSPGWTVFNECAILTTDDNGQLQERRPDRVMRSPGGEVVVVDFKFGSDHPKYAPQVKQYMQLLQGMGYNNVKGYLWFVSKRVIKEINC